METVLVLVGVALLVYLVSDLFRPKELLRRIAEDLDIDHEKFGNDFAGLYEQVQEKLEEQFSLVCWHAHSVVSLVHEHTGAGEVDDELGCTVHRAIDEINRIGAKPEQVLALITLIDTCWDKPVSIPSEQYFRLRDALDELDSLLSQFERLKRHFQNK